MKKLSFLFALILAFAARPARAYIVGPAPNLGGLNASCALVAKVTALDSERVEDASFETFGGFAVTQTRFRVVSVLKDETGKIAPGDEIEFRHFAPIDERNSFSAMYVPHYYRFVPGRSTLLWAKKGADGWRQFSTEPTTFQPQGALPAPDDAPVAGRIKDVIWQQTRALLRSPDANDQIAALEVLRAMSRPFVGTSMDGTDDFRAADVSPEIAPLIASENSEVALAAIQVARLDARRVATSLIAATSRDDVRLSVAALDALAPVKSAAVEARAREAARNANPLIGAAGLRLLGNFPDDATRVTWKRALASDNMALTSGAIDGIARGRDALMLPDLTRLLDDKNAGIQQQAANAMLRFPVDTTKNAWKKASAHPKWGPVFTVKLAENSRDMAVYLAQLTDIVAHNREPVTSGQLAVTSSRRLLLDYLSAQTRADLNKAGKFTAIYDALDAPSYLGQELDLWQFYRKSGLKTRAQNVRARVEKAEPQYQAHFANIEKS